MAKRQRPVVVSTRVTEEERTLLDAAARLEGVNLAELLHRIVMPAARQVVMRSAGAAAA